MKALLLPSLFILPCISASMSVFQNAAAYSSSVPQTGSYVGQLDGAIARLEDTANNSIAKAYNPSHSRTCNSGRDLTRKFIEHMVQLIRDEVKPFIAQSPRMLHTEKERLASIGFWGRVGSGIAYPFKALRNKIANLSLTERFAHFLLVNSDALNESEYVE